MISYAGAHSYVEAIDGSNVMAGEGSQVKAVTDLDSATPTLHGGAKVEALQGSNVEAWKQSTVVANAGARVSAGLNSTVLAKAGSEVSAEGGDVFTEQN